MAKERLPERIDTDRLVIRLWQPDDVAGMHEAIVRSIEHLRPWMPWIALEPLEPRDRLQNVTRWYDEWRDGGDAIYGIFLGPAGGDEEQVGTVVGGTGLHRRIGPSGLEIGYWIDADHLRRGYASESTAALTAVGLRQPGVDRVEIRHDKANVASAGVPKALGFTFVGESERAAEAPAESGVAWVWRVNT
jgi:RimJ/RimL family protein N-acetyltransferase